VKGVTSALLRLARSTYRLYAEQINNNY